MKLRLEWFIVPCVATMFGGNALSLNAQDPPKTKRNLNVVLHQVTDEIDAKSIREKVAKELSNSGISEETKARILKDVEEALGKAKEAAKKAKKTAALKVDTKEKVIEDVVVKIQKQEGTPATEHTFTTKFFRDTKGDGFRIGVQCIQIEDDDDSDSKPGIEVKAVVDDSPANKAGIKEGDILVTVDASKITKIGDLTNALQEAGKKEKDVTIELKRDDKNITVLVKPTKMKFSDSEMQNIQLALPTGGFVTEGDLTKSFQLMKKFSPENGVPHVWTTQKDSTDLKKDMEELKSEMAELKKMLKVIVDKK